MSSSDFFVDKKAAIFFYDLIMIILFEDGTVAFNWELTDLSISTMLHGKFD
jgi:hypothetical protein